LLPTVGRSRRTVSGAALLFRNRGGDLAGCRRSLESASTFAGIELLKLGEIDKAWATARLHLDGPIGERARLARETNPFATARPHLGNKQLDRCLGRDGDKLGREVCTRIARHLELCGQCREACEARRLA